MKNLKIWWKKNKSQNVIIKKNILVATIGEIARILNVPMKNNKKKHVDLNKKNFD